jgi:2-dehydropantoate 2-reductase
MSERDRTRALVVGAGAVGQVYGHHLARGGAEVGFLVKPSHVVARPLTLYPLNRPRRQRTRPVEFDAFRVFTDVAAVAAERWDQVYLTISSTALRAGDWFARLAPALGEATLVLLQPGPDDRRFVREHLPDERIVQGVITLVGYHAPLPGETRFPRPGVAYWFPPLSPSLMSGARRDPVLAALRAGGLPARPHRDLATTSAFPTALLMPLMAVLEQAGWSFRTVRESARLRLAARAASEALAVMARARGRSVPWPLRLLNRPLAVRLALAVAPRLMPSTSRPTCASTSPRSGIKPATSSTPTWPWVARPECPCRRSSGWGPPDRSPTSTPTRRDFG